MKWALLFAIAFSSNAAFAALEDFSCEVQILHPKPEGKIRITYMAKENNLALFDSKELATAPVSATDLFSIEDLETKSGPTRDLALLSIGYFERFQRSAQNLYESSGIDTRFDFVLDNIAQIQIFQVSGVEAIQGIAAFYDSDGKLLGRAAVGPFLLNCQ